MSIASTPANCSTGSWTQKWSCGWHEPVNAHITSAGYATGHTAMPIIIVGLIVLIILGLISKGRSAATSK